MLLKNHFILAGRPGTPGNPGTPGPPGKLEYGLKILLLYGFMLRKQKTTLHMMTLKGKTSFEPKIIFCYFKLYTKSNFVSHNILTMQAHSQTLDHF